MNRQTRHRHRRIVKRTERRWHSLGGVLPSSSSPDWQTFNLELQEIEAAVQALRQRFEEVRELLQTQQSLKQQLQAPDLSPEALSRLKQQLEELELQLESTLLFDWRSLQEPFWQAVRFGGLGIVVGWVLKGIVGQQG